jgi:hypothetical protein
MTTRRMKTYTGQTGYVYQYYFVGDRPALPEDPDAAAVEYVFDVSSDRKTTFAVSVFLRQEAMDAWQAAHGRALSATERYAAAKMRLFQGFDEIEKMQEGGRRLVIAGDAVTALLSQLGVE